MDDIERNFGSIVFPQEVECNELFEQLSQGFRKLPNLSESKQQALLRDMTVMMQECKTLIRDFEKEAKLDGMPLNDLNHRKKVLVSELNGFINLKKAYAVNQVQRGELMGGASSSRGHPAEQEKLLSKTTTELVTLGRKDIKETDASILRSERLVADTVAIGVQTAETLQGQGQQLEKVLDDLDEIHFTQKKARQVIRDMTRGLATDKCIMALLLLVAIAIVVVIVLKILKVKGVKI